jgi:hypothetical protein
MDRNCLNIGAQHLTWGHGIVRRTRLIASAIGLSSIALSGLAAGCTPPPPPPKLTFGITPQTTAGQAPHITYSSSGIPTGGRLLLQRTVGTHLAWATVKPLAANRVASTTAPGVPLGHYRYRVVSTNAKGVATASVIRYMNSYADLPLGTILGQSSNTWTILASSGSFLFTFVTAENIEFDHPSCRSMDLRVVYDAPQNAADGTVTVLQETADSVIVTTPTDTVVPVHVDMNGSAFAVRLTYQSLVNGTASCWTTNGSTS